MSVELQTAANIKYINIKMKKKLKNNSGIIYIIKDAGELCVKLLLFLLCCEDLEKIDFDFMKNSVKTEKTDIADIMEDDDEIMQAVNFWKERNVLDYEITSVPSINSIKGANMDNIINIILNISRDINIMNGDEAEDSDEFDEGLGIYRNGEKDKKEKHYESDKFEEIDEPEESDTDVIDIIDPVETNNIEIEDEDEVEVEIETSPEYEPKEIEESKKPEKIKTAGNNKNQFSAAAQPPKQSISSTSPSSPSLAQPKAVPDSIDSIDKVSESLETEEEFRRLIHETQMKLQTIFNPLEYVIMYNLYKTNGMETDLILNLAEICVSEGKNNIRYLEKVVLGYAADGITKMHQFEEKMKEMQKVVAFEENIRKMFSAGDRKFTSKEKNYIKKWVKEFDFADDVLLEGYRRCIKQIQRLSLDYIDRIYTNWHEKGFKTLDEINNEFESASGGAKNGNNGANRKNPGINIDQFMEKQIKKTLKF